MSVEKCLLIVGLSKNQFYYKPTGTKPGKPPSKITSKKCRKTALTIEVSNEDVIKRIVDIKLNPDHANYYRLITKTLCLEGYYINHKKVYRLMFKYLLLEDKNKSTGKKYVKYRRVAPCGPLELLEMDIKYVWVYEKNRYAFILTVIDTFTRYVLHWAVGYNMKSEQVKEVWEFIVAHYIQPTRGNHTVVEIEVRNDNGKQFSSNMIVDFFKDNELAQVFTHPYTPEENGHVESFHKTLGKALSQDKFRNLPQVEKRLQQFYLMYNNERSHGSIKGLPPSIFWSLIDKGLIDVIINEEKRRTRCDLKVAYQDILDIDGIHSRQYQVI